MALAGLRRGGTARNARSPTVRGQEHAAIGLLRAIKMGEPFLGRKTARAAACFTEENNQQLHEKAARLVSLTASTGTSAAVTVSFSSTGRH